MTNPERDIPRAHTAPQLGNEPSGIAAWLIRQAQQFEDQHAPQHLTIGLREAAGEIKRLRAKLREYLGADDHLAKVMPQRVGEGVIAAAIERVRAAKREARAALAQEKPND